MTTDKDCQESHETALVPLETPETALSPQEVVDLTKERAQAVMGIIEEAKAYAIIQGKRFLKCEAWQTIGEFDHAKAVTEWVKPVNDAANAVVAWSARVNLVDKRTGVIKGGAEMSCGLDEYVCKGKTGWAGNLAAQSMAQTRAESKAFRMNYSAVALMAGFEPTTAEEMNAGGGSGRPSAERDESAPFCDEHGVSFRRFENDRGSWYSHKQGDGWHNYRKPAENPEPVEEAEEMPW